LRDTWSPPSVDIIVLRAKNYTWQENNYYGFLDWTLIIIKSDLFRNYKSLCVSLNYFCVVKFSYKYKKLRKFTKYFIYNVGNREF